MKFNVWLRYIPQTPDFGAPFWLVATGPLDYERAVECAAECEEKEPRHSISKGTMVILPTTWKTD